ncbi:MAG: ketoacyl-ACP synthase III, partial [Streptosporangiaceae bacterium]|nr:ketoacyl-ACP synthase III [Streptosporangiaceae bacterium]
APDEATSDLAMRAAVESLNGSGLDVDQLGFIIVSTSTPDSPQPPTSYLLQDAIGARRAVCFDVNVVCSGFVYGLAIARSMLAQWPGTYALVVASDVYSRSLDFSDRGTAVLLGDGAGAAIVGPVGESYGFLDFELVSDGAAHQLIRVDAGGSRRPASHDTVDGGEHYFKMNGRGVRDFVLEHVPPVLETLVTRAGNDMKDVNVFVPHQANGVLLTELIERSRLTTARTSRTLEKYGNIGSASVAVALDEANRTGLLRAGDLALLAGFGGGMSIGACLVRWPATDQKE